MLIISANVQHGKQAEAALASQLSAPEVRGSVTWYGADFGTLKEVDALARMLAAQEERLDILVCNAGIAQAPYGITNDGLERHFQVRRARLAPRGRAADRVRRNAL